jgi:hypothetical protein
MRWIDVFLMVRMNLTDPQEQVSAGVSGPSAFSLSIDHFNVGLPA